MKKHCLWLIFPVAFLSACVTTKTVQHEKEMEAWLTTAAMPVTVQFQSNDLRCKPSLNCYTLIDQKGRVYYAKNVRHVLPRVIPEDTASIRPLRSLDQILFGRR
jgi:uncharacterized lipoprotein YajG